MMKKRKQEKRGFQDFLLEEDGIGVVEMILILVVLVGLILIFKEKLGKIVTSIFESIESGSSTISTLEEKS